MTYSYAGHRRYGFKFAPTSAGPKLPSILVEHPGGAFTVPLHEIETLVDDLRTAAAGARRNYAHRNSCGAWGA